MDWQALGYAITAFSGAVVALSLNWLRDWVQRPKLSIEIDLSALKVWTVTPQQVQKEIRLKIHNKGNSPADYCEAKIEPLKENDESLFDPSILHWVRNYLEPQNDSKHYAPITINSHDHEFLAMLVLKKETFLPTFSAGELTQKLTLVTASHRPYSFDPDIASGNAKYKFKVTIFSKNHTPETKNFSLFWNGTWDGFNKDTVQMLLKNSGITVSSPVAPRFPHNDTV